jgi:hypothetical protein
VVIGTDCIGSYKPNYHTITTNIEIEVEVFFSNMTMIDFFGCFIATFSNISAISWRSVLVVEEAGGPGELYHLRLRVECTRFAIYKAGREPTPYW